MFEGISWNLQDEATSSSVQGGSIVVTPPADAEQDTYYKPDSRVILLKRFEFIPKLQRMSVIVSDPNEQHQRVYVKGSPEIIRSLSRPETLPADFATRLSQYTEVTF